MKNLSLSIFALIITLVFSSCSQEETTFLEEPTSELFGKVVLSRDASGSYTMDLETSNDVASTISSNEKSNSLDIDLYNASGTKQQTTSEEMSTGSEDRFSVNLNNTITSRTSKLTIFDKDIQFSKTEEEDHLNSYSVTDNGDNTYDVNFTVDASIEVDFTQDEATGEYMIHLEPGAGTQTDYTVTFNREEGDNLQILFRNYYPSEDGRSTDSSIDKPKVIFE
ncbi:MAG: hypothetical protein P8L28_09745 [Flavobacteriaceae bacterium]|nr:hypothetical protein [Flavobacteriaceae bacterium]